MSKTLHGLPEKVVFCKKCCISNQRPSSKREFSKKSSSDTETVGFGDDVVLPEPDLFGQNFKNVGFSNRHWQMLFATVFVCKNPKLVGGNRARLPKF